MFKLFTSQNAISGMSKRFNGIWSKHLRQTMEKAITEKMEKIVQLRDQEKRFSNVANCWNLNKSNNIVFSSDGLEVETATVWEDIIATKGFPISSYEDGGMNMHYYEITQTIFSSYGYPHMYFGLSDGKVSDTEAVGNYAHSYTMINGEDQRGSFCVSDHCWISGNKHHFEWPKEIKPELLHIFNDVVGCGILVNRHNELAIFFTADGTLLGKQIPIMRPTANCLYPTVTLWHPISLRANFGDDLENHPFKYDIGKCPGLILE